MNTDHSSWIFCSKKRPDAKARLFCFPYAGSGASVFYEWSEYISTEIEICSINLPGHEGRIKENPYRELMKLVNDLALVIDPFLDKPFFFFGHSMGAHISFYLARYLRRSNIPGPMHMFVSGAKAPHLPKDPGSLHHKMEKKTLIHKLVELGGMVEEVLCNEALMDLILPVIRADLEMIDTMDYFDEKPLDCSISSFGGLYDPKICREDSEAWRVHTCGDFCLTMIPGKHLFLNTHRKQVINLIDHQIRSYL